MNIPDGWKLVPVEPTPEMVDAAGMGWYINKKELAKRLRIWKAMVDAAPACNDVNGIEREGEA